jgi:hypothetical protein
MRHLGQGLTAAVALMALLAALIGACPCAEPPRSADVHDCCATSPGFRAAVFDCCSSPGDAPLVVGVPCVHVAPTPGVTAVAVPAPLVASPAALAGARHGVWFPSPVLRI